MAVVGTSGSGKSTLAGLLPRFYDLQGGAIRIDGTDVSTVTLDSLRRSIGLVFEDSFLFSDTIRANIAYGRPDATDAEVERRGPHRRRPRLHRRAGRRLRHGRRRAGPHALGRPAPAHRAGPGDPHRPQGARARRRDLGRRQPHRGRDPRHAPRRPRGPHDHPHRPPPFDAAASPIASPCSTTGHVVDVGTHDELDERCAALPPPAVGSGRRRRGRGRARPRRDRRDDGQRIRRTGRRSSTRSARPRARRHPGLWRRDGDDGRPPRARRGRAQGDGHAVAGRGHGRRWRRRACWAGWPRRPSCWPRSSALPPAARPSRPARRRRPAGGPDVPASRRFLRPWRAQLAIGLTLVVLDGAGHARRTDPRAPRDRRRVSRPAVTGALWAATLAYLLVVAGRLGGDDRPDVRHRPHRRAGAVRACGSGSSPTSSGSASTTTTGRWAGGS